MQPTERATCFLFGTLGNVENGRRWCAIRVREGPWVRTYCGATLKFDVRGQSEGEAGCPLCIKAMRRAEQDNHNVDQTPAPPMSGSITEDDVVRWFGIPPDKTEHFVRCHKQFKAARERQEDRLREACQRAGEWVEAYMVDRQGMPTPPGHVADSMPVPPSVVWLKAICPTCLALERIVTVRPAPLCSACYGEGNPTPAPPASSPAITEEDVARWLHVSVETLRNTPRLLEHQWVDRIQQILATLERIPCMSEDCDGIEDGEPVTKDCPEPTRCHRCEAVRLAKGALDSG